jgi:DNA-directed RNA polymerase specialized sigma24 family protein
MCAALSREASARLAWDLLPSGMGKLVLLRARGLSPEAIATALGLSPRRVDARLAQASAVLDRIAGPRAYGAR